MFEPEIARRCLSCGASVRQRASFCPQCGQVIVKEPDSQVDSQTTLVEGQETQVIATDESPDDAAPITPDIAGAGGVTQMDMILPEESDATSITPDIAGAGGVTQMDMILPEESDAAPITPDIAGAGGVTQMDMILPEKSDATPITPDITGASAVTQIDLILPEELRPHPFPMAPETQPLITQAIQREPSVSEADAITPHATDLAHPTTEHHLIDRMDRLRKVTSVIDQAAYDPSLRFLLVAAFLFILFVILMVLSKVIS